MKNPHAYSYEKEGRNRTTAVVVIVVLALLSAAWIWLEAATWIVLVLGAFTLPALYDLYANPSAGLALSDDRLTWFSGRHQDHADLSDIDHVRLDTRLDFSVRATAVMQSGTKRRIPFESTPPHQEFETALQEAGIKVIRHHFQLFQ